MSRVVTNKIVKSKEFNFDNNRSVYRHYQLELVIRKNTLDSIKVFYKDSIDKKEATLKNLKVRAVWYDDYIEFKYLNGVYFYTDIKNEIDLGIDVLNQASSDYIKKENLDSIIST